MELYICSSLYTTTEKNYQVYVTRLDYTLAITE